METIIVELSPYHRVCPKISETFNLYYKGEKLPQFTHYECDREKGILYIWDERLFNERARVIKYGKKQK